MVADAEKPEFCYRADHLIEEVSTNLAFQINLKFFISILKKLLRVISQLKRRHDMKKSSEKSMNTTLTKSKLL